MCEGSHSRLQQAAISGFLIVFLAVVATANIPGNPVASVDDPALRAVGARQVWSVFAPDPLQVVARVSVRFVYRDGTTSTWKVPRHDYRWLKLAENVPRSETAAQGLLLWAARTRAEPKPLVRADLIREVYDIAPPGKPRSEHSPVERGVVLSLGAAG